MNFLLKSSSVTVRLESSEAPTHVVCMALLNKKSMLQRLRFVGSKKIVLLTTVLCSVSFFAHLFSWSPQKSRRVVDLFELTVPSTAILSTGYNETAPFRVIGETISILRQEHRAKISIYLKVIQNSVKIISLPSKLHDDVKRQCIRIKGKPPIYDHQHSLELRFPLILQAMSRSSRSAILKSAELNFDPLWDGGNTSNGNLGTDGHSSVLLYYVESLVYHAIYCTNKAKGKEDWLKRDPYWTKVAEYLIALPEWSTASGLNFLVSASHPAAGPSRHHPFPLSYLQRASFLRTDFDVSGNSPKDIVVPYYVAEPEAIFPLNLDAGGFGNKWLLFFAGGRNPINGYRESLGMAIGEYIATKHISNVHYSTEFVANYMAEMGQSIFCLIVRGDTTSSKRLFSAIKAGCVPVIISDWIQLPYSNLIDYSQFSLRFPESIVQDVAPLFRLLQTFPPSRLDKMRHALYQSRHLLLYEASPLQLQTEPVNSVLNPVTLALIEAVLERKRYCEDVLTDLAASSAQLCQRIRENFEKATLMHRS